VNTTPAVGIVWCSVVQCVAVWCSVVHIMHVNAMSAVGIVCCSVLQCCSVAVCYACEHHACGWQSVVQCVAVCCSELYV